MAFLLGFFIFKFIYRMLSGSKRSHSRTPSGSKRNYVRPSSNFFSNEGVEPGSEAAAFFARRPAKPNAINELGSSISRISLGARAIKPEDLVAVEHPVVARGPFNSRKNPFELMTNNRAIAAPATAFATPAARHHVATTTAAKEAAAAAAAAAASFAKKAAPFTAAAKLKHIKGGKRRSTRRRLPRSKTSKKRRSQ